MILFLLILPQHNIIKLNILADKNTFLEKMILPV